MIRELLKKLELSDKEVEIYLALFEQGKTTPARLSRITRINRSTVYAVLEQLKERGLVIKDITTKILYFSPTPTDDVENIFCKEQENLKEKKKIVLKLAEELERMPQSKTYSVPKIRFVQEDEVEEFLFENIGKWDENTKLIDHICWGFQDRSFAEVYQKWILWSSERYAVKLNLFSNESKLENKLKEKFSIQRNFNFLKNNIDFSASTWIFGDYLIMIMTRQKPYYLVEIHDAVLAHNMREMFKELWKQKTG
jgi:sugar-specific transcriptional regulator TrmB